MAIRHIIVLSVDLHVRCDLCSFEWVDKLSNINDDLKLKCCNCLNMVDYDILDIRTNVK